jgi:DNA/RNA endonuclease YhcR with UshA esterase domain
MKLTLLSLLIVSAIAATIVSTPKSLSQSQAEPQANKSSATIEGLVRDIACPIQNLEAKPTEFNLDCAVACARKGSPLIIQTEDGTLYIPISDSMPDVDQREKMMPFVGKYVRASGTVYERKGTRAIVIAKIEELKNVPLKTDAQ